ncbi:hydrogenase maturation protease [Neptuniibacter sp.]|uniref:hydrogenase maturation protease n=1 Tax=Neptuniibacter sp. TaxID=1962643 RepID=UPI0026083C57|nr:hydrogenase maturation protease [Neptuniibacter sp.]MCP4595801.1 hydrogenase maturation protease [Neptuniibacter sp.]
MNGQHVTQQLKVSLLFFGNEWHGDDGFGYAVFKQLQIPQQAKEVDLHFCGCNTMHAWSYMENSQHCILVDALKTDQQLPGAVAWYTPESFCHHSPQHLHDAGIAELIRHIPILSEDGKAPGIELLCVTTNELEAFTNKLSPSVERAVETACQMIQKRLVQLKEAA